MDRWEFALHTTWSLPDWNNSSPLLGGVEHKDAATLAALGRAAEFSDAAMR